MAQIQLILRAYRMVNSIRYQLNRDGNKSDWREIVRTMNTHKTVTTLEQNVHDEVIMFCG